MISPAMRSSPIPPPLWMLIFGVAMWALNRYWPWVGLIPPPWNRFGWFVMALAPIAPISAVIQFRQARTTPNPHRPDTTTTLVTSGVYAWTRNPMYLGLSILLLGWAITLGGLSPFLGPVLFPPLLQKFQIAPEEAALRKLFGQDYEAYCRRVGRWLGRKGTVGT